MRRVIWLLTETVFALAGGNISFNFSMNMGLVILGRQTDIHSAKQLVPEPSASEFEMAIEK